MSGNSGTININAADNSDLKAIAQQVYQALGLAPPYTVDDITVELSTSPSNGRRLLQPTIQVLIKVTLQVKPGLPATPALETLMSSQAVTNVVATELVTVGVVTPDSGQGTANIAPSNAAGGAQQTPTPIGEAPAVAATMLAVLCWVR